MTSTIHTHIINFLDKHISSNIDIPSIDFTNKSIKLLSILFYRIALSTNAYNPEDLKYNIVEYDNNIDIDYYPDDVKKSIKTMNKIMCNVEFTINNHDFSLNLICDQKYKNNDTYFSNIIKQIYIWLCVATEYSQPNCSQILKMYIFFTKNKKELPVDRYALIGQPNVNTAYTYACKPNNILHIYREEEWFKVFIHETFHSFGLDFAMIDTVDTNRAILKLFPVKSDVRLAETYSEVWAEIINIMFIVHNETPPQQNVQKWMDALFIKMNKMLRREQEMSIFQSAKILHHYGLSYNDMLEQSLNLSEKYKEDTHVLSYYIIKSIMMYNINGFIEWCVDNNVNNSIQFNQEYITEKSMLFCNLVQQYYNNPNYINAINSSIAIVDKLNKNGKVKSKCMKTLRMSFYG